MPIALSSADTISELQAAGIRIVMLTGDTTTTARSSGSAIEDRRGSLRQWVKWFVLSQALRKSDRVPKSAGRPLPDYKLLNLRYGVCFEPQDMDMVKALPAGLLGRIRLIPTAPE